LPPDGTRKVGMDSLEATSHPFVVRIWLEDSAGEAHRATWRGHITHVPSGARRYLHSLDDMASFVAPYLESMGIKLSPWWRARRWVKRLGRATPSRLGQ
jgi:biotin carboxylase